MADRGASSGEGRAAIAGMTGERLRETLGKQVRQLLKVVGNFESQVRRFTATTEVMEHGAPTVHTRAPATPVGLFSVGEALIACFDPAGEESPEVADLLRVYTPEGRGLRLAPNPLAHHKGLTRWIQDLYLSHRGRVRFAEVMEEPGRALLAFEVQHGAGRGARRHLLGLDLTQGLEDIKLLRHPMPQEPIQPDFTGFKELDEAQWIPGERTNAYYHHTEVGPLYVFLEWGALKVRDYLEVPRGTADLVIEAAADPDHSVNPDRVEMLPSAHPEREVFARVLAEEGRPPHYIYYSKRPRRIQRVDVSGIPGLDLPGRAGKISSMFLWSGGEMIFLGGLPAAPVGVIEAPGGADRIFIFQREEGPITLHHFESKKRKVLHTFPELKDFTLSSSGHLYFFSRALEGEETPALEHTLGWYLTPFKAEDGDFSPRQQAYLRTFNPEEVEALADAARRLQEPLEEEDYGRARDRLDQLLVAFPFVERAEDIRGAIQELFGSLSQVTAIEQELSEIHDRRREALADFEEEANGRLAEIGVDAGRAVPALVEDIGAVRALLGRLERLGQEKNQPPDVVDAHKGLSRRLKGQIKALSKAGATSASRTITEVDAGLDAGLEEVESLDNLVAIEAQLSKVREDRQTLREVVDRLSLLEIEAQESLTIAQAGTAAVVKTDRLEKALTAHRKGLSQTERQASFQAYLIQLDLRIATEPSACRDVEDCDGRLDALLAEIEATKGEYGDFPALLTILDERLSQARRRFEARKLTLVTEREEAREELTQRFELRLSALTVAARGADLDPQALEGFLATHPEALRCEEILERLRALGQAGQASRLMGRLDQARRLLVSERQERAIFAIEGETLALGGTRFVRNRLAIGVQERFTEAGLVFQISGTRMEIPGAALGLTPPEGFKGLINETAEISRAEFLAFRILRAAEADGSLDALVAEARQKKDLALPALTERAKAAALALPEEEHTLGLHDRDAAEILRRVAPAWVRLGALSYPPTLRVEAAQMWARLQGGAEVARSIAAMLELGRRLGSGQGGARRALARALEAAGAQPAEGHLAYLIAEAQAGGLGAGRFTHHPQALVIAQAVRRVSGGKALSDALATLSEDARLAYLIPEIEALLRAGRLDLGEEGDAEGDGDPAGAEGLALEAAYILATGALKPAAPEDAPPKDGSAKDAAPNDAAPAPGDADIKTRLTLRGLASDHPRTRGSLVLDLPLWYGRLSRFADEDAPRFARFTQDLALARIRLAKELELETLAPRPLARFAWTRLLQRVTLPLIAQALQKQLGSVDNPGSDQMGLLLLVSPPGYGKTEVLKKVSSLLGFGFVSISGTALGTDTHSLDPDAAPNKAAAAALDRLLRGLELGDNLIVDIEDVHACSESFLEKLLPLCDATRTVEVARNGELKRISLQGQRVAVVMTLNPLRANIPQALANRATLINLGDVAERYGEEFGLSYLEVAAPANPTLERVSANRDLVTLAQALTDGRGWETLDKDLNGRYAAAELRRIRRVLEHAVAIRDVLVAVNRACLKSATVQDAYRDAPAFELQGSYRDMVEVSRRIEPDWDDEDRRVAILNHYEGQAGLLASQGEANLLTLKAMLGNLGEGEAQRLDHIRHVFKLNQQREQTLLTLLDRLTEVSEAVQRVPAAVNAHGEHLVEQLSRAFEGASHTLLALPEAAASASVVGQDPMQRALIRAISSLEKAIVEGSISQAGQLAESVERALAYLFGGGAVPISAPTRAPRRPAEPELPPTPTFTRPAMAPRAAPGHRDLKTDPGGPIPEVHTESSERAAASGGEQVRGDASGGEPLRGDASGGERAAEDISSEERASEDTSGGEGDPLDLVEDYADADPDTFIARLLEAESRADADARKASLLEIARPNEFPPKGDPAPEPKSEAPSPEGDASPTTGSAPEPRVAPESPSPSPAAPAPSPPGMASPPVPEAGPELPPTPPAEARANTPPTAPEAHAAGPFPMGGALGAALSQALASTQVQVSVAPGEPPPWSRELKASLDGVREDLSRLAALAEKRPKNDIVSTLRGLLKALPEGD